MAIGLIKKNTSVALKAEAVEGVQEALADGDDFIQVLEDGLEMVPGKELVERTILVPSIGQITPRTSTRSVTANFPVEWRASGVEGGEPDYFVLLDAMLGNKSTKAASVTDGGVGTTTSFPQTATALVVGDFIVIEDDTNGWHPAFVVDIPDANTVTFSPATTVIVPASTDISAGVSYSGANSGQPSFSGYVFWGDEIAEVGTGMRVNSMSLENFTTGQIPTLAFASEGLTSVRADGSAPFVAITSSNPPPVALGAVVQQGDVCIDLNEVGVSLENAMSFLTSVKSPEGKISSRFTARTLTGTMNPYLDDTTTANFWDKFVSDEPFAIILTLGIEDPLDPLKLVPGSNVGMYLPQCLLTEDSVGDVELLLVEQLAFIPNAGPSGDQEDIFMGFS